MENDIILCPTTCALCGDDAVELHECRSCGVRSCGCCVGRCAGCGDLVCADCADPGPPLDPGCPECVARVTRAVADLDRP